MGILAGPLSLTVGGGDSITGENLPTAIILPASKDTVLGTNVKLDGSASFSTFGEITNYIWTVTKVPIGSKITTLDLVSLESDNSVVTLSPDIVGPYEVQLVVSDASSISSPTPCLIDTKLSLVPYNSDYIPDASFIWSYLSDFWARVEGKKKIETIWSSMIQIVAAELLKLYQYNYNKSIRDIQAVYQRRWVPFTLDLDLTADQTSFVLAEDKAGTNAVSLLIEGSTGNTALTHSFTDRVSVPSSSCDFSVSSFGISTYPGRLLSFKDQSFTLLRSVKNINQLHSGSDGAVTALSDTFDSTGFTAPLVGKTLRMFFAPPFGSTQVIFNDFLIDTYVGPTQVTLTQTDGSLVSFTSNITDIPYVVFDQDDPYSTFISASPEVPAGLTDTSWRFSSTLISAEHNFESEGVTPGDFITFEITKVGSNDSCQVEVQVVSVDENKLGFVCSKEVQDGVAVDSFSSTDQLSLTTAFGVSGLSVDSNSNLVYIKDALILKDLLNSGIFKRKYFEKLLSYKDELDLGLFKVAIRPVSIKRRSKIAIDTDIISVPTLQEYIKQPNLVTVDGKTYQVSEDNLFLLDHTPYILVENQDYVVDAEESIAGTCTITSGSGQISIDKGDLLDRSIKPGDSIEVSTFAGSQLFTIVEVINDTTLSCYPFSTASSVEADFIIKRKIPGKFIRFTEQRFSNAGLPKRFWAEIVFCDNSQVIENNFGVLLGVKKDDLDISVNGFAYKKIVHGLMYALTMGPTVSNLGLAANILLGLPFTEKEGTISEINPSYRIRDDGSPLLGRILVTASDGSGTSVYFYPQGDQIEDPLNPGYWIPASPNSGLAINPDTGIPYAVGDNVKRFVALTKGADVVDYLTDSTWADKLYAQGDLGAVLYKYHSLELLVNSNLVSPKGVDLALSFLQLAKPTYTKMFISFQKTIIDLVEVAEQLSLLRPFGFWDNISLGFPTAIKFDYPAAAPDSFISVEGVAYTLLKYGVDLSTTYGSTTVTSAAGGFITAPANAYYDAPYVLAGDLLVVYEGNNSDRYVVGSVISDTQLGSVTKLNGSGFAFETLSNQYFAVYRPSSEVIQKKSSISITNATSTITVGAGLFSAGVTPGDSLCFYGGAIYSRKYTIVGINFSTNVVTLDHAIVEASGTYSIIIVRVGRQTSYLLGRPSNSYPFRADFAIGSKQVVLGTTLLEEALFVEIGDLLIRDTGTTYEVLAWDPSTKTLAVADAATANETNQPCQIKKQNRSSASVSTDIMDRMPGEELSLTLESAGQDLLTSFASPQATTVSSLDFGSLGIQPGDFLVIYEGPDSIVDVGYGVGVYPIISINDPGNVTLVVGTQFSMTNASPGYLYGIKRRKTL